MTPLVSIITINYNQVEVTCALLDTLACLTYPKVEVIVVDNGSAADEAAMIRDRHPDVHVIARVNNTGFTGGNNTALCRANGDYLLLLNNDTEVPPGFLEPLVDAMKNDDAIGLASPKIRFFHSPDRIQYAGGFPINPYTGRGHLVGYGEIDQGQHDRSGRTHLAHGAAMLIRRCVLERIGMLGDLFFIYYEEFDFSERARRAGYAIEYVAGSVVLHKESVTVGKENAFKTYYMTRNRLLYLRRNVFGLPFWFSIFFFLLIAVPRHTIRYLARRRFDLLSAFYRGLLWHVRPRNVHGNPTLHYDPPPTRPHLSIGGPLHDIY